MLRHPRVLWKPMAAGWEGRVPHTLLLCKQQVRRCWSPNQPPQHLAVNLPHVLKATLGCHFLWRQLSSQCSWRHPQNQPCSKTAIQELRTQSLTDRSEDFERESLLWEWAVHPARGMSLITISQVMLSSWCWAHHMKFQLNPANRDEHSKSLVPGPCQVGVFYRVTRLLQNLHFAAYGKIWSNQ